MTDDMKRCFLLLAAIAAAISTTGCGPKPNTLTAKEKADGWHRGYTKNYTPVKVKAQDAGSWRWQTKNVRITGVDGDCCTAEII